MEPVGGNAILGHEQIRQYFANHASSIGGGAWLFVGPHHLGKRTTAQALTRVLLCQQRCSPPCESCESCQAWRADVHPDAVRLAVPDGETSLSIDAIRSDTAKNEADDASLTHRLSRRPLMGDRFVVIIEQAEQLTPAASNALLKVLEEPPANSVFLLTASSEQVVLPTIRSRCAVVRFAPIPVRELAHWLEVKKALAPQSARSLARQSQGLPGLALADSAAQDSLAQSIIEQWRSAPQNPFFLSQAAEKDELSSPLFLRVVGQVIDDVILGAHGLWPRLTFPTLRALLTPIVEQQSPDSLSRIGQAYRGLLRRIQRHVQPTTAADSFSNVL